MAYDFDRVIDRAGTNATKLQKYAGTDILPFWIADMDFAVPDFILDPLRERHAQQSTNGLFRSKITVSHRQIYFGQEH